LLVLESAEAGNLIDQVELAAVGAQVIEAEGAFGLRQRPRGGTGARPCRGLPE
jgi:hypothetical protein